MNEQVYANAESRQALPLESATNRTNMFCNSNRPQAADVPISELEHTFGGLITVATYPHQISTAQGSAGTTQR